MLQRDVGTCYFQMDLNAYYKIGFVARPHGLKGEVTVMFSNTAPDLSNAKSLFLEINHALVPYFIEHISDRGDKAFLKFEEVETSEAADRLKGISIYLLKKERPRLNAGEFYDDEVVGFEVVDENHGVLGEVTEVQQIGPNRLLSIKNPVKEMLIPINGPFIKSVNKTKKRFLVSLPDGFLDI
jgi:16S rRNA processing protein RimM